MAAAAASGVAVDQDGQSVYVTNGSSVLQYDVGSGGKLSPKSPPAVAAAGAVGVAVSPPLNHPLTDDHRRAHDDQRPDPHLHLLLLGAGLEL